MMAATSKAFTFGFAVEERDLPSDNTEISTCNNSQDDAFSPTTKLQSQESISVVLTDNSTNPRRPFSFFETDLLRRLLKERSLEEIIHDELHFGDVIVRKVDTDRTSFVETGQTTADATTKSEASQPSPSNLKLRDNHPSDLLPGVYEGGAAVWEGSLDLLDYLETIRDEINASQQQDNIKTMSTKSILELGCGHALPSLYLLQTCQPELLVLTDYNDHVLKDVTISNLVINHSPNLEYIMEHVVLGSGDWMQLGSHIESVKLLKEPEGPLLDRGTFSKLPMDGLFELILAAETLYTPKTCKETAYLIDRHLSSSGTALVSTKRYYFGVGGGADAFRDFAEQCGLLVETVHVVNTGRGNVREVLRVSRETKLAFSTLEPMA